MSTIKNPVLSLGARGSLSEAITFTRRRKTNIAEKKPELPYFLTLPVQYQRWLYQDYVELWNRQSWATKQFYASRGVRYHLTGFQYWMKYHLTNLPDIAGWWKLDDNQAPTTVDSSRNANDGTIIGASPATGLIGACLSWDGINDVVTIPNSASLNPTQAISIEAFIHPLSAGGGGFARLISKEALGYAVWFPAANRLRFGLWDTGLALNSTDTDVNSIPYGSWSHFVGTYDGAVMRTFVNGVQSIATWAAAFTINTTVVPLHIGNRTALNRAWDGRIDNVFIMNRAFDPSDILRHSLRRYTL